jgi:hypothetical protein
MRLANLQCLGSGILLEVAPYNDTYWKDNLVLDEVIVEEHRFPMYKGEKIH